MNVNRPPQRPIASAPAGPAPPGPGRLYLRDDALDGGAERLLAAADRLRAAALPALAASKLNWTEGRFVMAARHAAQPVLALGARLGLAKQATLRLAGGLEARGLIARAVDPRDRRRRLVRLTDAGAGLADCLAGAARAAFARAYREAGGDAVAGFEAVVSALTGRDGGGGA